MPIGPKKLLIEGWRGLPHSYAMVNQSQILELLGRPEISLAHRDLDLLVPQWKAVSGLYSAEQERKIAAIRAPSPGERFDAVYRIGGAIDFRASPRADRTVVFTTAEYRMIPRVYTFDKRPIAATLAENATMVVTPSNWSREGLLASGAAPERVVVVPHGVDRAVFWPMDETRREETRRAMGWNGFIFITVGAGTLNKGIDLLLKATAIVRRKHPQTRLMVKGLDELYHSDRSLAMMMRGLGEQDAKEVGSILHYRGGAAPFEDMAMLYQLADAYVAPYRAEGFCLPALEAAACGAPVICTAGGPTDDFIRDEFGLRIRSKLTENPDHHGETGTYLEPELDHLVELMCRVIEKPEIGRRAREAGPKFVQENFTWGHAVERLLPVLFDS
jgi:glycosyltransferase involved in cell wall biosynthesis